MAPSQSPLLKSLQVPSSSVNADEPSEESWIIPQMTPSVAAPVFARKRGQPQNQLKSQFVAGVSDLTIDSQSSMQLTELNSTTISTIESCDAQSGANSKNSSCTEHAPCWGVLEESWISGNNSSPLFEHETQSIIQCAAEESRNDLREISIDDVSMLQCSEGSVIKDQSLVSSSDADQRCYSNPETSQERNELLATSLPLCILHKKQNSRQCPYAALKAKKDWHLISVQAQAPDSSSHVGYCKEEQKAFPDFVPHTFIDNCTSPKKVSCVSSAHGLARDVTTAPGKIMVKRSKHSRMSPVSSFRKRIVACAVHPPRRASWSRRKTCRRLPQCRPSTPPYFCDDSLTTCSQKVCSRETGLSADTEKMTVGKSNSVGTTCTCKSSSSSGITNKSSSQYQKDQTIIGPVTIRPSANLLSLEEVLSVKSTQSTSKNELRLSRKAADLSETVLKTEPLQISGIEEGYAGTFSTPWSSGECPLIDAADLQKNRNFHKWRARTGSTSSTGARDASSRTHRKPKFRYMKWCFVSFAVLPISYLIALVAFFRQVYVCRSELGYMDRSNTSFFLAQFPRCKSDLEYFAPAFSVATMFSSALSGHKHVVLNAYQEQVEAISAELAEFDAEHFTVNFSPTMKAPSEDLSGNIDPAAREKIMYSLSRASQTAAQISSQMLQIRIAIVKSSRRIAEATEVVRDTIRLKQQISFFEYMFSGGGERLRDLAAVFSSHLRKEIRDLADVVQKVDQMVNETLSEASSATSILLKELDRISRLESNSITCEQLREGGTGFYSLWRRVVRFFGVSCGQDVRLAQEALVERRRVSQDILSRGQYHTSVLHRTIFDVLRNLRSLLGELEAAENGSMMQNYISWRKVHYSTVQNMIEQLRRQFRQHAAYDVRGIEGAAGKRDSAKRADSATTANKEGGAGFSDDDERNGDSD